VPEQTLDEWKWASVFIEVALRAVRRVHYEYGLWGIGPQWKMDRQLAERINLGPGIELALETSVCAAITQEFIGSPSLSGLWVEQGPDGKPDHELRYFMIEREKEYRFLEGKADLFMQKFTPKDGKLGEELVPAVFPSFIEAKRARLWTADIKSGQAADGGSQISGVKADVAKLREEITGRRLNCPEADQIRGHVLVWGAYGGQHGDHPLQFFRSVAGVELHTLRWLPLTWKQPSRGELNDDKLTIPTPQTALWIGLAEVKTE
jgi:hypothetical protein